ARAVRPGRPDPGGARPDPRLRPLRRAGPHGRRAVRALQPARPEGLGELPGPRHDLPGERCRGPRPRPRGSRPRRRDHAAPGDVLGAMSEAGADVVGVDWHTPLDVAATRVPGKALQGNLDPCVLFAPFDVIQTEVRRILVEGAKAPGHVFNLGHGVLPETDPD